MADKELTALTELTNSADGDWLYIVDVSDLTESTKGTSKKIKKININSGLAPIASPTFTGTPSAPTATVGTNTTQLATTAFVLANAGGVSTSVANTWSALQTFLNGTLGLRNVANTFTSFFTNTNTAARTYTLQNRDITFAGLDDIGLIPLDEGNGIGYVIGGRNAANYGSVGLRAVDLGYSDIASGSIGATGYYSGVLSGLRNTASGQYSVISGGGYSTVSAQFSGVLSGFGNTVSAQLSVVAGGNANNVSGQYAGILSGSSNIASGYASGVLNGELCKARSYGEVVGGVNPTDYTPTSATTWSATDRIFNIGNGANSGALSNAFTILKNGLATLPSVTNALITAEATGKAVVTKEYLVANATSNIVKDPVPSSAVTGTLTETILKSYLIPANTFATNDMMNIIDFKMSKTGVANTVTLKIYINTSNSLSGAVQIGLFTTVAANTFARVTRSFTLNGGNLKGFGFTTSSITDVTTANNGLFSTAFNTTVANYIITTATLVNTGDSVVQSSFQITN